MTGGTLLSGLLLSFDGVDSLPASPAERAQLQYVPWFGLGLQESAPGSEWEAAMHDKLYAAARSVPVFAHTWCCVHAFPPC